MQKTLRLGSSSCDRYIIAFGNGLRTARMRVDHVDYLRQKPCLLYIERGIDILEKRAIAKAHAGSGNEVANAAYRQHAYDWQRTSI